MPRSTGLPLSSFPRLPVAPAIRAAALASDEGGYWATFKTRLNESFPNTLTPEEDAVDIRTLLPLPELFSRALQLAHVKVTPVVYDRIRQFNGFRIEAEEVDIDVGITYVHVPVEVPTPPPIIARVLRLGVDDPLCAGVQAFVARDKLEDASELYMQELLMREAGVGPVRRAPPLTAVVVRSAHVADRPWEVVGLAVSGLDPD